MKISEILREAGIMQQPKKFNPGVIQPSTSGAQFMKDIGSAISAGGSGNYYTQGATATEYKPAPVGAIYGKWEKTDHGWINTQKNTAATSKAAEQLDREWYRQTQAGLKNPAAPATDEPVDTTASDQSIILGPDGKPIQRSELPKTRPATAPTAPATAPTAPALTVQRTVITPTGQTVEWKSDGRWYRKDSGTEVTEPADLSRLEKALDNADMVAKARGMTPLPTVRMTPAPQPATTPSGIITRP